MKIIYIGLVIFILACNNADKNEPTSGKSIDSTNPVFDPHAHSHDTIDVYSNETFKEVRLERTGETVYSVTGKARVFEAVYHYLVKDGNEVVTDGRGMTDAGAPEFGNFSFTVDVKKKVAVESMYLILFEASAKDGSRQYELPIPLQ
jgi:immunoglobulin-like protein involved in spore germination